MNANKGFQAWVSKRQALLESELKGPQLSNFREIWYKFCSRHYTGNDVIRQQYAQAYE